MTTQTCPQVSVPLTGGTHAQPTTTQPAPCLPALAIAAIFLPACLPARTACPHCLPPLPWLTSSLLSAAIKGWNTVPIVNSTGGLVRYPEEGGEGFHDYWDRWAGRVGSLNIILVVPGLGAFACFARLPAVAPACCFLAACAPPICRFLTGYPPLPLPLLLLAGASPRMGPRWQECWQH
jgi:hypothetical protein